MWRTLVPAIPVVHGKIPQRAFRAPIPAPRERPAPRRSEVRWYPIHVYQHDPPSQSAAGCPEPRCLHHCRRRPVDMWTSPHPCGPARAKAVWTTHGPRRNLGAIGQHRAGAAHRLPTLSGLSPTYPQALQQAVLKRMKRCDTKIRCQQLTGQNISAVFSVGKRPTRCAQDAESAGLVADRPRNNGISGRVYDARRR